MFLSSHQLPLAALENVLEVVLPIIFMILYGVSQLLTGRKRAQQAGPPPKQNVLPRDKVGGLDGIDGRGAGKPDGLEAALRKEVDQFLRLAQGKQDKRDEPFEDQPARLRRKQGRPQQARKQGQPQQARKQGQPQQARKQGQPQQARSSLSSRRTSRPATGGQSKARDEPKRLTPAADSRKWADRPTLPSRSSSGRLATEKASSGRPDDSSSANLRSQSVTAHVASHISHSSQAIGQHAEQLGDSLEITSDRTQHRIEQKFDHQVGSIRPQEDADVVQEQGLAEEIADLLRSPEGMRQLIIANEILNRPVL